MNRDVGIVIQNPQHISKITPIYNAYLSLSSLDQFVVFSAEPLGINFVPQLPLNEAYFFDGNLLVLELNMLLIVKDFLNYRNLFYYLEQPDWIYSAMSSSHTAIKDMFTKTKNLNFITQNNTIYDLYKDLWGDNITLGELNYEKIIR